MYKLKGGGFSKNRSLGNTEMWETLKFNSVKGCLKTNANYRFMIKFSTVHFYRFMIKFSTVHF